MRLEKYVVEGVHSALPSRWRYSEHSGVKYLHQDSSYFKLPLLEATAAVMAVLNWDLVEV